LLFRFDVPLPVTVDLPFEEARGFGSGIVLNFLLPVPLPVVTDLLPAAFFLAA
jgi:hypothetical protein